MPLLTLAAALAAGTLTVLSPCVLPILPVVFGSATAEGRMARVALAGGVATAFTGAGLVLATSGAAIQQLAEPLHQAIGAVLVVFGAAMLAPPLKRAFEQALAPIGGWGSAAAARAGGRGVAGQAGLGLLLGAVWSPCVGPTLGAASVLASQGRDLGAVAATMAAFGVGAAVPLLILGSLSRSALQRWRGAMSGVERWTRRLLGVGLIVVGLLAVSGQDKAVEAALVGITPDWLIALTSSV